MLQAKWFKRVILSKGPKRQNGIEVLREGRGKDSGQSQSS